MSTLVFAVPVTPWRVGLRSVDALHGLAPGSTRNSYRLAPLAGLARPFAAPMEVAVVTAPRGAGAVDGSRTRTELIQLLIGDVDAYVRARARQRSRTTAPSPTAPQA